MQLCLYIWFSIVAMKMLGKATAIFVSMAVLWVCSLVATANWNQEFNIRERISPRYLVGTRRGVVFPGIFGGRVSSGFPDPISD